MLKFILISIQLILLLSITFFLVSNSFNISFDIGDLSYSFSSNLLVIFLVVLISIIILLNFIYFKTKFAFQKYFYVKKLTKTQKGYDFFVEAMIALLNKDNKSAITSARKMKGLLKQETSLNLLLQSEILKIEKKSDQLNDVYDLMIKNNKTKTLGYRGLMEQSLKQQDYHHAFIYGEKLFNLNPKIDKLHETLINIIGKTNNWQKLLQINDQALRHRIISKNVYEENQSIALYEIAKIKRYSSENEAMGLMEKALKLRTYFSPFVSYYIQLLIDNNKLSKAKKYLNKAWSNFSHPDLKQEIKLLSKTMKIPYYELAKFITSSSPNTFDSKILLTESLIENENWQEAKQQLSSLLEHKPDREVCLLMAKIEEGDTNDPQKVNSWISRSNFGNISKIWVCRISNVSQSEWSSVSKSGYFNSLDWKYPRNNLEFNSSPLETQAIEYI